MKPVASIQPGHRSPECMPSDVEGSTAPIDRKAKKRIQNRVAQRTYRTRIKQRLQDLQQQVQTLQQKEEEQQREAQRENKPDEVGNEEIAFHTPVHERLSPTSIHGQGEEQPNPEVTCRDFHCIKMTNSGPWARVSGQPNMWNHQLGEPRFAYDNSFNIPGRPPLATMPALSPTELPVETPSNVLCSHTSQGEHPQSRLGFSPGIEGTSRHRMANPPNITFEANEERRIGQLQGVNSSHLSPWLHKLELGPPTLDLTPGIAAKHPANMHQPSFYQDGITSPPLTSVPAQWPETILPNPQTSVEEQLEYVLNCAQRVGFDSFDTMALHYYTRNFNPTSTIALQQHLSRNQRLPELLSELRKQSTNWSEWQRRGYQGEALKAAEEICAMEYGEFRKCEGNGSEHGGVNEAALGDMLPNLWALLTRLVSSNQQLSQRQTSEVVFTCMKLLCGLDGSRD
ncbi:hypothetical protein F4680DRAFT_423019 [Xylaria scruposa]|nr:hypothetical protein F4680DRAFT_423019 [Xylaria scruposa]